jgi:hypothetical protein
MASIQTQRDGIEVRKRPSRRGVHLPRFSEKLPALKFQEKTHEGASLL